MLILPKNAEHYKNINNLLSYIKIGKQTLTFGVIEIGKNIFYPNKIPVPLRDVDIEKVVVSDKIGGKVLYWLLV